MFIPRTTLLRAALSVFACFFWVACGRPSTAVPASANSQEGAARSLAATLGHRQVLEKIFSAAYDCSAGPEASPGQLRRLTRAEYSRSAQDALGLALSYEKDLPPDEAVFGFKNNTGLNVVTVDHAVAYARAAQKMAEEFVDTLWVPALSCGPDGGESCARQFLDRYGRRLWRRPLTGEETQKLLAIYQAGAEVGGRAGALLMLRGLLTAPAFLYRSELGQGEKRQLDAYQWASSLSYFFWSSGPDDALLNRAADGSLMAEDGFKSEIDRLLSSPKARDGLKSFADSWTGYTQVLQVSKDTNRYPLFDGAMRQRLALETEDFFDRIIRQQDGRFADLLGADYTFGDASLAAFYEAPVDRGTQRIDLSSKPRRGILGHGSILASLAYAGETNPIKRGKFVREHLLCEELLPPPPTLNIQPPPPKEGASTRERFAVHSSLPACKGCHLRLDGAGFGLEDFDAIGRYRTTDAGKPVDASGTLYDLDGTNRAFAGGRQMSEALMQAERSERCFALQWYRMAHGRVESEADVCAVRQLAEELKRGLTVRELMIKVITQSSYRQRSY